MSTSLLARSYFLSPGRAGGCLWSYQERKSALRNVVRIFLFSQTVEIVFSSWYNVNNRGDETMKKVFVFAVFMLFSVSFRGCVTEAPPDTGIWYCEELEIYLDMSASKGVYLDENGEYSPLFIQIDYGTVFFINYCEDQWCEEYLNDAYRLRTNYRYKNGILRLHDMDSDKIYDFVEIDEAIYPGG